MQLFVTLLFLLSSHVAMVTAWAGCYRDRDKDHRTRENCTALGFSEVPRGFEPTTKVMLFPNNLFSRLSWSSFQIFIKIYELDLTGNKISEVSSSVPPILPSLSVLRLGSNRLTALSDGSFSACPALTELYLDNNAVDSLSNDAFSGLGKLEILDLSSNRIQVLPKLMLHPLPAIETLYLDNNKIKVIPDDWFSQKEEVPYLFLSANPWDCSCPIFYLRRYLDDFELNVYVRNGPVIKNGARRVVCDSPRLRQGKPVIDLEEDDLCSTEAELDPVGDYTTTTPLLTPTPTPPPPTTTITSTAYFLTTGTTTTAPIHTTTTPTTTTTTTTTTTPILTTTIPVTSTVTTITTTPIPTTTTTTIPTTTTSVPTTATSTATPAYVVESSTEYHRVVTWYQTFTRSGVRAEALTLASYSSLPAVKPSAQSPANTTSTASAPLWAIAKPAGGKTMAVRGAGVFCFWLFTGCLLLCVAAAVCVLATVAWLVIWYRRVYKPLSAALVRRGGGGEVVRLITHNRREGKEVAGGGVMALYRSVLFVHREGGEAMLKEDGGKEGEGGGERLSVNLEPTGRGGAMTEEEGRREDKGVYRKTLYRLLSKEEEIEGWRDVMEEWRVSAEDGRRRRGEERSGEVSRKCYSIILREEREETGGGREELDWVVGGWEVKGGGGGEEEEGPRSSWGEWLAHYLPSMPWGLTTPPDSKAGICQKT